MKTHSTDLLIFLLLNENDMHYQVDGGCYGFGQQRVYLTIFPSCKIACPQTKHHSAGRIQPHVEDQPHFTAV